MTGRQLPENKRQVALVYPVAVPWAAMFVRGVMDYAQEHGGWSLAVSPPFAQLGRRATADVGQPQGLARRRRDCRHRESCGSASSPSAAQARCEHGCLQYALRLSAGHSRSLRHGAHGSRTPVGSRTAPTGVLRLQRAVVFARAVSRIRRASSGSGNLVRRARGAGQSQHAADLAETDRTPDELSPASASVRRTAGRAGLPCPNRGRRVPATRTAHSTRRRGGGESTTIRRSASSAGPRSAASRAIPGD